MSELNNVAEVVSKAKAAQKQFEFASQEQADAAARAVCKIIYDNAERLAALAVEETAMGNYVDKIAKCRTKSQLIWNYIKDKKTVGIISRDEELKILEVAKPMGVVASVIPSTNPVVTPMSNAANALKTRNAVIFSPHPKANRCTRECTRLFREELEKLGLPADLVQTLDKPDRQDSAELMHAADIVVATGGSGLVKRAYSSGRPAVGVGPGNVQCIVDSDVDLGKAAADIILGRSFDNGLICLGEQTAFVPESKFDEFVSELCARGTYYIDDEKLANQLREAIFPDGGPINRDITGQSAEKVAEIAGLQVPENTRMIAVKAAHAGSSEQLCREKMCPVITLIPYSSFEEGVDMMCENLEFEGKGHSISVHSNTQEHVELAAIRCCVSRVIVNQPAGTTGGGSYLNGFIPTTTLGCGSWGGNSFSGNFNYTHLMNISRVGFPYEKTNVPPTEEIWN